MPDVTRPDHLPPLRRVGHKGADHVAPGNTFESFQAALDLRVDMIEFDVLRLRDGRLVLAHDYEDAGGRTPHTLEEGLDHFADDAYADTELDVDLKLPGYEREVVEGILARGLGDRVLISSQYRESLERVGELAPAMRRGWSVPKVRRDYTKSVLAPAAYAWAGVMKRRLPAQAARVIASGGAEALMSHMILVSRRLVEAVHGAGGQLYVWTVDDSKKIAWLESIGVDGVITNDPRLFGEPAPAV
jgi:glycerophosphoryl diester phosphodiesterase